MPEPGEYPPIPEDGDQGFGTLIKCPSVADISKAVENNTGK